MSGQGDLVERLRVYGVGLTCGPDGCLFPDELLDEAAEEIERLLGLFTLMRATLLGQKSPAAACLNAWIDDALGGSNSPPSKAPE